jgi:hypothetical protein
VYGGVRLPWSARYQAHQRTGRADIMLINEFELNLFWEQSSVPGHPQIPPGLASLGPSYGQVVYLPGETNRFINYSLVSYANSKCSTSYRPRTKVIRRPERSETRGVWGVSPRKEGSYECPSGERSGGSGGFPLRKEGSYEGPSGARSGGSGGFPSGKQGSYEGPGGVRPGVSGGFPPGNKAHTSPTDAIWLRRRVIFSVSSQHCGVAYIGQST